MDIERNNSKNKKKQKKASRFAIYINLKSKLLHVFITFIGNYLRLSAEADDHLL